MPHQGASLISIYLKGDTMAKATDPKKKSIKSISYRVERESTHSWKAIRLTVYSDDTFEEDAPCHPNVLEIVLRHIGANMRQEGQIEFLKDKTILGTAR